MTEPSALRTLGDVLADVLPPESPAADPSRPADSAAHAGVPPLSAVFRDHHDFVWSSARRLGCPSGNIDDAVQEVFLIASRKLGQLRHPAALRSWLFRTTMHVIRNHRRAHRRRENRNVLAGHGAPDHTPDPSVHYEAAITLLELLELLDEDRRAVFVLTTLEQWTAPEIADALKIKLNTVYSRLRSARELLGRAVLARGRTP